MTLWIAWAWAEGLAALVLASLETELGVEVQGGPGKEREMFSARKSGKCDVSLSHGVRENDLFSIPSAT